MTRRTDRQSIRGGLLSLLVALLLVLSGCGPSSADKDSNQIAWGEPTPSPTDPATAVSVTPDTAKSTPTVVASAGLTAEELNRYQPDELGRVPVMMYHALVYDAKDLDEWSITPEQFTAQLEWLYEHDFYVIPMLDLINNTISAPAGKHPVVLTFDDASSRQFRLIKDANDKLVPDPKTMVGMLEKMFAAHPDFGRGGMFAVVSAKCFTYDEEQATCEQRLTWLAEHGYEVGNHTATHQNLSNVSDERFKEEVGGTELWINARVSGKANLGRVLILPFGEWPRSPQQVNWMKDRFTYNGEEIRILAIVEVSGGAGPSPSSGDWDRRSVRRVNSEPAIWDRLTNAYESGRMTFFTSDGNPGTVTIPNQIPSDIADEFDAEWARSYDMILIRYDAPASNAATSRADRNDHDRDCERRKPSHRGNI